MATIHSVEYKTCPKCNALMIAEVNKDYIGYRCIYKHELHPPLRFRDIANGE